MASCALRRLSTVVKKLIDDPSILQQNDFLLQQMRCNDQMALHPDSVGNNDLIDDLKEAYGQFKKNTEYVSSAMLSVAAVTWGRSYLLVWPYHFREVNGGIMERGTKEEWAHGALVNDLGGTKFYPDQETKGRGWSWTDPEIIAKQGILIRVSAHYEAAFPAPDLILPLTSPFGLRKWVPSILHPLSNWIACRHFALPYLIWSHIVGDGQVPQAEIPKHLRIGDIVKHSSDDGPNGFGVVVLIVLRLEACELSHVRDEFTRVAMLFGHSEDDLKACIDASKGVLRPKFDITVVPLTECPSIEKNPKKLVQQGLSEPVLKDLVAYYALTPEIQSSLALKPLNPKQILHIIEEGKMFGAVFKPWVHKGKQSATAPDHGLSLMREPHFEEPAFRNHLAAKVKAYVEDENVANSTLTLETDTIEKLLEKHNIEFSRDEHPDFNDPCSAIHRILFSHAIVSSSRQPYPVRSVMQLQRFFHQQPYRLPGFRELSAHRDANGLGLSHIVDLTFDECRQLLNLYEYGPFEYEIQPTEIQLADEDRALLALPEAERSGAREELKKVRHERELRRRDMNDKINKEWERVLKSADSRMPHDEKTLRRALSTGTAILKTGTCAHVCARLQPIGCISHLFSLSAAFVRFPSVPFPSVFRSKAEAGSEAGSEAEQGAVP
jgi:hypothetical protein